MSTYSKSSLYDMIHNSKIITAFMEHAFHPLLFLFICLTISSADFLQNPDFEIPPPNITANGTSHLTFPGWSVSGTVWYAAWGGGHAVQLGPNGKINQTVTAAGDDVLHYVLGFTVAAQNQDCASNLTALNVTLSDSWSRSVSRVIRLQQNSSRNMWERHALFLGQLGGGNYVHVALQSIATNSCWPLVDAFAVNRNHLPRWYNGNVLANAGFEVGPAFVKNSPGGIILNEEQEEFDSPLQEWSILGTVRYIDSGHYKVPRGRAAVELLSVSGEPSGVQKELMHSPTPTTLTYTLDFSLGDANDSCVGNLMMYIQVGSSVYNFTVQSSGTGSAAKHSLTFKVEPSPMQSTTSISFYSLNETRTRDGLLCGPVLDGIFLDLDRTSRSSAATSHGVLVFNLFVAFLMLIAL